MSDLGALEAVTEAVASGAGLPEVVRAAARALDASLVVVDRSGQVLAVAARSPVEEETLVSAGAGVETVELRVADQPVGLVRLKPRGEHSGGLVRVVATILASEVERLRGPDRASVEAAAGYLRAVLGGELTAREAIVAGAAELGIDLHAGASLVVARARPHVPVEDGWRDRILAIVERGARATAPGAVAAPSDRADAPGAEVVVLVPGADEAAAERAADGIVRELRAALPGYALSLGRSRAATDPADLRRAGSEAQLAANVAEGDPERPVLSFDETGTYKLLLGQEPAELHGFYAETIEPLVAYDAQYETDLVATVAAFLEADGNVAATSQRLYTHRHTVRYRLDRVRELSGLDVGSSDGREKLSLGLKAMRVLGIAAPAGPASEAGTEAGRVPRR